MCALVGVVELLGSSTAVVACSHTHFRREEQKQSSTVLLRVHVAAPSANSVESIANTGLCKMGMDLLLGIGA